MSHISSILVLNCFLVFIKLIKVFVRVFQLFYDADILEEKAFDEWSSKVSKKYVSKDLSQEIHDRAAPFLTWLKVAEEEESESEEEDDDLEVSISLHISAANQIY